MYYGIVFVAGIMIIVSGLMVLGHDDQYWPPRKLVGHGLVFAGLILTLFSFGFGLIETIGPALTTGPSTKGPVFK